MMALHCVDCDARRISAPHRENRLPMSRRSWLRWLPLAWLGTCASCAHVPVQSESLKAARIEASTSEIRTRVVELGRDLLRETEAAADSIDARTGDPRILRNTLLWRLCSVPAVIEAALRVDPVMAALDLSAYRAQLSAFLASPLGEAKFGPDVVIARRAIDRLGPAWEGEAAATHAKLSDATRVKFDAWVASHPIETLPYTRPSAVAAMASLMSEQASGLGAAVGGIQESMDRLELRVSLANEYTIKQATWLAQLAALDVAGSTDATELRGTLGSTRNLLDSAPDLVAHERVALLADVDRQRLETLAAVSRETDEMLAALTRERVAVLAAMDEQRRLVMQDADTMRTRVVSDSLRIVDHGMLRLAELLGGLVVAGSIGMFLSRRRPVAALSRADG